MRLLLWLRRLLLVLLRRRLRHLRRLQQRLWPVMRQLRV
jgi:hypothetical protein